MNIKKIVLLFSIIILLLTGCDLTGGGEEEISAEQILTYVAETVSASLSLTPPATNTNTPTVTSTATSTFTASPSPTNSPTVIVVVNNTGGNNTGGQAAGCDNASFVSDVTIPDGTQFAPGTAFTKTWRLQNSGTCAWTTAYSATFINGDQMSGVTPQLLTSETASGTTRDVSVELIAPNTAGTYTGYWQMKNAAGQVFGDKFYVQIVVTGSATTSVTPTATATGATPTPSNTPLASNTPVPTALPTATATTQAPQPDLTISFILNPASPTTGATVDVTIQVNNQGNADAGPFTVAWWADENSGSDNTWAISSLAANSSTTLNYTYPGYAASGSYTAKAEADTTSAVAESNEGNNASSVPVNVQ